MDLISINHHLNEIYIDLRRKKGRRKMTEESRRVANEHLEQMRKILGVKNRAEDKKMQKPESGDLKA